MKKIQVFKAWIFNLVFCQQLIVIFSVFDRCHLLLLREYAYEVGLVVETAVIAYFRCSRRCVYEQVAGLCNTQVVNMSDEGYSRLLLEEVAEC